MRQISLHFIAQGFFLSTCEEREEIDPKIHILGKWENSEGGNWPDMVQYEASGFTEYREDSVVLFFDYKTNAYTFQSTYWITDSLLIEKSTDSDGSDFFSRHSYVMKKNWMRTDHVDILATNRTAVFTKIE